MMFGSNGEFIARTIDGVLVDGEFTVVDDGSRIGHRTSRWGRKTEVPFVSAALKNDLCVEISPRVLKF